MFQIENNVKGFQIV